MRPPAWRTNIHGRPPAAGAVIAGIALHLRDMSWFDVAAHMAYTCLRCEGARGRRTGREMRDDTRNWIASADYDVETAQDLFEAGRYPYVIFMCHLALEKMLKAHVTEVMQSKPAKTHSLPYLVRKAGLDVPPEMRRFFGEITNGCVPMRYPDNIEELLNTRTRDVAEEVMRFTREAIKWLKDHPNLQE